MDDNNPRVEAVYTKDGRIEAVGSYNSLKALDPSAEEINLSGNTLMPGFIEPHLHVDLCAIIAQMHIISGLIYPDSKDVIAQLQKAVSETPKGEWILCFGLDYLLNRDFPEIDRYWLDELTKDHPIALIIQSMHTMYINSLGLARAGIDRNTQDTRDGHCLKDESGEPIGILTEQGFLMKVILLWLKELHKSPNVMLEEILTDWSKKGITTIWTAGYYPLFPGYFDILADTFNNPSCPIRGDYSISFNGIESGLVNVSEITDKDTDKTRLTGIKSWYDGSPYTGNTLMYHDYLENDIMQNKLYVPPHQNGENLFSRERFLEILRTYHGMGYQLSVHSQGDRAGHEVLDMFSTILKESPRKDHRHRLEHCAFIDKADLKTCGELGLTLSFHTNHLYYYGEALKELVVGEEVTEKMLPCRSALDQGIKISFHSDAPMYDVAPLRVAANAVTRTTKRGTVIGADEAITLTEALRGITIDAAWQLLREKDLGSIEVGKFADFTLLSKDPYEVDPLEVGDIPIITTYLSGVDTKTMHFD